MLAPKQNPVKENRFIDEDIFDRVPQNTIRFKKPVQRQIVKKQKQQTIQKQK